MLSSWVSGNRPRWTITDAECVVDVCLFSLDALNRVAWRGCFAQARLFISAAFWGACLNSNILSSSPLQ